ncbi:MAG TPA: hypothetical protein VER14_04215 [Phototrophicaceae bacterium]|nr:hypothetical protein [Phototrophicaceae bacterium]
MVHSITHTITTFVISKSFPSNSSVMMMNFTQEKDLQQAIKAASSD